MSICLGQWNLQGTDRCPSNIFDFLIVLTGPVIIPTNICALISSMVWLLMVDNTMDWDKGLLVNI